MWLRSYSIGGTIPIAECRRLWLYQVWTHWEISCRAEALVVQTRERLDGRGRQRLQTALDAGDPYDEAADYRHG